jgi:hypothetical protein
MQVRLPAFLVAVAAVAVVNGCNSTGIKAQLENVDHPDAVVYALNGTPARFPAAILFRANGVVIVDASFLFDLAFDLDTAANVKVYTVRAIASQFATTHRVGLTTTTEPFAQITRAPTTGYVYDSSMVLPVGRTLLVDVIDPNCNQFSILGQDIRAKLVIDSVKAAAKTIYVHFLVNQNCGFRSLVEGLPAD